MNGEPEDDDDAPPVPGMLRSTPEAALAAEKAAHAKQAAADSPDAPAVTDEKLKQLKTKARAEIEARLSERRKKRKLLRGNHSDSHPTL